MCESAKAENRMEELSDYLVCPIHNIPLRMPEPFSRGGMPWPDGIISCDEKHSYHIREGIPRLLENDKYAEAFGLQWQRYQKTQYRFLYWTAGIS